MKSLSSRFNGNMKEVLDYAKRFGRFAAMQKYGGTPFAWHKFLAQETGDPNFGLNPTLGNEDGRTVYQKIVDGIVRKITDLEVELEKKNERIKFLEYQLEQREGYEQGAIVELVEAVGL